MAASWCAADQQQFSHPSGLGCKVQHVQQAQVTELVSFLGDLALSCYGPGGRSKAVGASKDTPAGVITSTSSRLFTGFHIRHPYLRLLLQTTASSQQQQYCDGGLLTVQLACRLVAHGLQAGTTQSHRADICKAYQRCADHVAALLGQQLSRGPGVASSTRKHARAPQHTRKASGRHRDDTKDSGIGGRGAQQACCKHILLDRHGTGSSTTSVDVHVHSCDDADDADDTCHSSDSDSDDSCDSSSSEGGGGGGGAHSQRIALCLDVRDAGAKGYLALAKGVLGSKQSTGLSADDHEAAALLLVRAFVSSLPAGGSTPAGSPALPQLVVQAGLGREDWGLSDGVLVTAPPRPRALPLLPLGPCLVALFQVPLEPGHTRGQGAGADQQQDGPALCMEVHEAGGSGAAWSPASTDLHLLVQLLLQLKAAGVKLLACQKGIHEEVAHAALTLGLIPLARLSASVAHQLAAATGALPLTSTTPLPPHNTPAPSAHGGGGEAGQQGWARWLGVCGGVQIKALGSKQVVHILPPPPSHHPAAPHLHTQAPCCTSRLRPATSLVLGASSDSTCDELRAAASAVLRVLHATWRVPWVLPGGGATEALLAEHLRVCARHDRRRRRIGAVQVGAYEVFAAGLESAACQLLDGCGHQQHEVIEAFRSTTQPALSLLQNDDNTDIGNRLEPGGGIDFIGWLHDEQQFSCVAQATRALSSQGRACMKLVNPVLLDSLPVKMSAVLGAVEAACMMLKVDNILLSDE